MTLRFAATAVGAAAALLVGCSDEPFPPRGEAVQQARERAEARTAAGVAPYERSGRVLARGSSDGCAIGQRNWKVDDGYEVLFKQATAVVVGLVGADARQAAGAALTPPGGCVSGPSDGADDPRIREQSIVGFIDYLCEAAIGTSDDDPSEVVAMRP